MLFPVWTFLARRFLLGPSNGSCCISSTPLSFSAHNVAGSPWHEGPFSFFQPPSSQQSYRYSYVQLQIGDCVSRALAIDEGQRAVTSLIRCGASLDAHKDVIAIIIVVIIGVGIWCGVETRAARSVRRNRDLWWILDQRKEDDIVCWLSSFTSGPLTLGIEI